MTHGTVRSGAPSRRVPAGTPMPIRCPSIPLRSFIPFPITHSRTHTHTLSPSPSHIHSLANWHCRPLHASSRRALIMSEKVSVLFVCLGNICRSTMAEGVFRSLVKDSPYQDKIGTIDSCGTGTTSQIGHSFQALWASGTDCMDA